MYATDKISPEMICSGCWNRCMAGNACCLQRFTSTGTGYVALAPTFPTAKVVPVFLSSPDVGEKLYCQRGAYMASYGDVSVEFSVDKNCMRCCCAGMGLVRQKLKGTGTVFLAALGTIVQKVLQEGEVILCDQNCVLAFGRNVTLDVKATGGLMGMIGGGEGIYNTKLTGPGLVLIQSVNELQFRETMTRKYA